jgi:TonB family protein
MYRPGCGDEYINVRGLSEAYSLPMSYAPLPEYPAEARAKHCTAMGKFLVRADTDAGVVNGVTTIRSTGYSILDKATEKALYRWKFPPGVGAGGIIIPVTFTSKGVQIEYGAPKEHAFTPNPDLPADAVEVSSNKDADKLDYLPTRPQGRPSNVPADSVTVRVFYRGKLLGWTFMAKEAVASLHKPTKT